MIKIWKNLTNAIFCSTHKEAITKEEQMDVLEKNIILAHGNSSMLANYLIAMARLQFIKPERLEEEAANLKANSDYLLKLSEIQQKEKNGHNKN